MIWEEIKKGDLVMMSFEKDPGIIDVFISYAKEIDDVIHFTDVYAVNDAFLDSTWVFTLGEDSGSKKAFNFLRLIGNVPKITNETPKRAIIDFIELTYPEFGL